MKDKYIEIMGIKIRYKAANTEVGRNVVFLHGMAFNADTWDNLGTLDLVAKEGFSVYAIDMPGFGKSGGKRLPRKAATEFLKKILDNLRIDKCVLVGPSMGGGIALSFAIKYIERILGLILIAPAGLNDPLITNNLHKINAPTLIFWGENDSVFPVSMGKELKDKIANSRFVLCSKARHPCYLDTPDIFHKNVLEFLRSIFRGK